MVKITKPKTAKSLATFCAKIAAEKIATDINIINLQKVENATTDFFVLCSTDSPNQSQAILDVIMRQAKKSGLPKPKVEGENNADWILIDFFDVVMHIMLKPIREYYNIEKLWSNGILYRYNEETDKLNKVKIETNKIDDTTNIDIIS
jgi:ribosome-associated protein